MEEGTPIKKMLEEAVRRKQKAKDEADFKSVADGVVKQIAGSIAPDDVSNAVVERLSKSIEPVLVQLLEKDRATGKDIADAIREIEFNLPAVEMPEIPEINTEGISDAIREGFSKLKIPAPIVNTPKTVFPTYPEFPREFGLRGVDKNKPLPVMMMGADGKPAMFPISGGGGGKTDFFTILGINNTVGVVQINPDGSSFYSSSASGSSSTIVSLINGDGVYYNSDNPLPVTFSAASVQPVSQVSGSAWSVSVTDIFGSTGANVVNPDGRIKVEIPSGSSGLTDTELRASSVPVAQASGAVWSTSVTSTTGLTDTQLRASAVEIIQVSGSVDSVVVNSGVITSVTDITNSVATNVVNSSGVAYSGSNPFPVSGTVAVSGISGTTASANVDSTGVQYSGSNPLPVYLVLGSGNSTLAVGDLASDAVDTGSAPVKIGGIARTANPTAVAAGDRISATFDDVGRQVMRPVQVRDLMRTAYVAISNGTETTLLAGATSTYHDLIWLTGSNASDAAVTVSLRASTGGTVLQTLQIPANGTAGISASVPYPAPFAGHTWTADLSDITGTTVYLTGLFSAEV